ncbi:putative all-trans-retinol 13,14-reductase [Hordeum vulgare]|nr:putative all-trans-retinol 13,14-reductase [Hordeum vulgare]
MASSALASPAPRGHCHPRAFPAAAAAAAAPVLRRVGAAALCRAVATPAGSSPPGVAERSEENVVVIGSGLGKLCCAGLLARFTMEPSGSGAAEPGEDGRDQEPAHERSYAPSNGAGPAVAETREAPNSSGLECVPERFLVSSCAVQLVARGRGDA